MLKVPGATINRLDDVNVKSTHPNYDPRIINYPPRRRRTLQLSRDWKINKLNSRPAGICRNGPSDKSSSLALKCRRVCAVGVKNRVRIGQMCDFVPKALIQDV